MNEVAAPDSTACGPTFRLTQQGFTLGDGTSRPFICLEARVSSREWAQKQGASMTEYLEDCKAVPADTLVLYRLFDTYIAAALHGRSNAKVLDIGCGIKREWPEYVATLRRLSPVTGNLYAGLDPIVHDVGERAYPFICARIEDLPACYVDRFDAFLFATSLDHFEDLDKVAAVVRRLAAEDSLCIFWVGLHDAALVGEQIGARAYRRLFTSLSPIPFAWQYLRTLCGILLNYARLWRRRSKLLRGRPLDGLHFHYFTNATLKHCLKSFGTVVDTLHVPGGSSVFVTVRLRASEAPRGNEAS